MEQLIYFYDPPEGRNHNISTFYDLVKRDHIYTINTNLANWKLLWDLKEIETSNFQYPVITISTKKMHP